MPIEKWSEKEVTILIDNFSRTRKEIQELLEDSGFTRTIEAIKTKKRDLRAAGEMPTASEEEAAEAAIEPATKEEIFGVTTKKDIYLKYREMLQELVKDTRAISPIKDSSPVVSGGESVVLMLSDLHIGKVIIGADGNETFNTPIAIQRIRDITSSIMRVIEHAKRSTDIDEIVVAMIGDIVDNEAIYSSHAFHIDSHVAEQVKVATRSLWEMIVSLAEIPSVKKVRIATVRGNHGRSGSMVAHEDSNFDNIVYDNIDLAAMISENPKISVVTKYSDFHVVEVRGHRILFRHEAPITCDTSAARAKLGGWVDMHKVDAIASGHFHHPQVSTYADRYVFRNGALTGQDDLAERMAVTSSPSQLLFGVTEKRLPTFIYPVTLD